MKTLHRISILVAVIFTQTPAQAHGGENLLKELKKRDNAIKSAQSEFVNSHSDVERMEHLNTQVEALNHKILTLRNLIAKEYPYVKENMSKYKLDYMGSVDESLVQTSVLLEQLEQVLEE